MQHRVRSRQRKPISYGMKQRHFPIQRAGLRISGSIYFSRAAPPLHGCLHSIQLNRSIQYSGTWVLPWLIFEHISVLETCLHVAYDDSPNPAPRSKFILAYIYVLL